MLQDLLVMQPSVAEKIIRTVLVYTLIVVLIRLTGKRGLSGMSTLDLTVIFLLSNVVQNAIIGDDNSVLGGAIGAVTLVLVNAGVSKLIAVSPAAERLLQGTATTVIRDGQIDDRAVRRLSLRTADIEQSVRQQSGDSIADVRVGSLEPNGQLVITLKDSEQSMTRGDLALLLSRLDAIERRLPATGGA